MQTVAQFINEMQPGGFSEPLSRVRFVLFDAATFTAYQKALNAIQ